jgi:uncharacterized membrane protein YhaH (DUF805 family)
MNWFIRAIKNYATFSGRAQRAEYWYFVLFYLLIFIGLAIIDSVTGTFNAETGMGLLSGICSLALFIPSLSVSVRRLHDIGKSGWWLLVGVIPLIGAIVMLIFLVKDGESGENMYGSNPKANAT